MTEIHRFTIEGKASFLKYLIDLRKNPRRKIPRELLHSKPYAESLEVGVEIQSRDFKSKLQIGEYLSEKIQRLAINKWLDSYFDPGIWGWLAAFYFDEICEMSADGTYYPGATYRYLPFGEANWRNYYRHLLAFPVRIFASYGEMPHLLFHGPPHHVSDYVEQIGSRQEIVMNRGVLEATNILYWDDKQKHPKSGATSRNRPGNLRRFIAVIQQLDLTYDLFSLSGNQIVGLLPASEFKIWST